MIIKDFYEKNEKETVLVIVVVKVVIDIYFDEVVVVKVFEKNAIDNNTGDILFIIFIEEND